MIAHLRGQILTKTPNSVVVECGGVGYELAISVATYSEIGGEGKEVRLHVHTHVREDALALYGFAELQEKRLFEKLLTISGIGPKLAITVLSGISAERLVGAIRAGDHATLTRIPGIGKKTAERVVLELKDKLDDMAGVVPDDAPRSLGRLEDDVVSALVNLGYARSLAMKAVEAAHKVGVDYEIGFEAGSGKGSNEFEILFRAAMAAVR